jgi:hypothetical protein
MRLRFFTLSPSGYDVRQREGEGPAELETTAGRRSAGDILHRSMPPAVAELKLVLGFQEARFPSRDIRATQAPLSLHIAVSRN